MKKIRSWLLAVACSSIVSTATAATFTEDFGSNPLERGWSVFGVSNLFEWNAATGQLHVTWNSSEPNSYFWRPLGTILSRDDNFSFSFDLLLTDIAPANEFQASFQLAAGLMNIEQATQPGFLRATGFDAMNLVEFDYFRADEFFPDTAFPTLISSNGTFNFNSGEQNSTNHTLTLHTWHRVEMTYSAAAQAITLAITRASDSARAEVTQRINETFTDFRAGAFSISSYSHAGQFPGFEGSILAHGIIDNIELNTPPPPVGQLSLLFDGNQSGASFESRTNFTYVLERSTNLATWTPASVPAEGTGGELTLHDSLVPESGAFYRVRAERP